jgi:transcriptional regulator with XRE-family HTH domain
MAACLMETFSGSQSYEGMKGSPRDKMIDRLPVLLRQLRTERRVSMRVLADSAGINVSEVSRVERGQDAHLSTWEALFDGLGHRLEFEAVESSVEGPELPAEESHRRRERRRAWLNR